MRVYLSGEEGGLVLRGSRVRAGYGVEPLGM